MAVEASAQRVEQSRREGFERGRLEGHERGYAEGEQAARRDSAEQLAAQCEALSRLLEALSDPLAAEREALKPLLTELVSRICREVCQRELLADNRCIESIVSQALAALPFGEDPLQIDINPADLSVLESLATAGDGRWPLRADKRLQRGDCRVVSSHSQVDFFTDSRLQDIVSQTFSLGER